MPHQRFQRFGFVLKLSKVYKEKYIIGKKVVFVLVCESQETHMRHRPPWYDISC